MRFGKQSIGVTSVKSIKTKLCVSGKAQRQIMLNATRKAQRWHHFSSYMYHYALNQMCSLAGKKVLEMPKLGGN